MEPLQLTEKFVEALNRCYWNITYSKFCEILEVPDNQWAEEKYKQFQEMILALNKFDVDTLSKFISDGQSKK